MPTLARPDLRTIVIRQRVVLVCILLNILIYIGGLATHAHLPPALRVVVPIGLLVVALTATAFVFLLAIKLYGTAKGVILGILTLIPLVGLVTLVVVNGKATRTLRENGIKVGLLGAKNPGA